METAKITFKGQVTIPKKVRTALGIQAGDLVLFSVDGEKAVLKPFIKKSLLDFYGIMPLKRKYSGFETTRQEVHQKISETVYSFDRHFDRVAGIERLAPLASKPGAEKGPER